MMVDLLLSGIGSVGFKSSFIVPVLWILSSILFGATSFSIVALANEVVEDRHIWLLSTSMIIMDKMINNRTTEIRTIMMGRNLAAFRLSIPVVVAANCFSPGLNQIIWIDHFTAFHYFRLWKIDVRNSIAGYFCCI